MNDPKKMHFVRIPRSQQRSGDSDFRATDHSRNEMFDADVDHTESWISRLLNSPLFWAVILTVLVISAIGLMAAVWGWRP